MKIAFTVFDYEKPGGIEKYVRELSGRFYLQNHDIHIFTTNYSLDNKARIAFHKIQIPGYLPFFVRLYLFNKRVNAALKKNSFDIIHSQGSDNTFNNIVTAHSCHKAWVERAKKFSFWEYLKKMFFPLHSMILHNESKNYSAGNPQSTST